MHIIGRLLVGSIKYKILIVYMLETWASSQKHACMELLHQLVALILKKS
jgi:hypothetical protein